MVTRLHSDAWAWAEATAVPILTAPARLCIADVSASSATQKCWQTTWTPLTWKHRVGMPPGGMLNLGWNAKQLSCLARCRGYVSDSTSFTAARSMPPICSLPCRYYDWPPC